MIYLRIVLPPKAPQYNASGVHPLQRDKTALLRNIFIFQVLVEF
jgi:hypothetical protein